MLNTIKNNFRKYNLYYLYLLGLLFLSINSHSIGKYPLVKKLNNGKYIVVSSTSILFLDPTLTIESNVLNITNTENYLKYIEQFSHDDGDYIIVLSKNDFYIFSQDETLLSTDKNNSLIYPNTVSIFYSIIPYNHNENDYNFFIIFLSQDVAWLEFYFIESTFNSVSNTITFSEPIKFFISSQVNGKHFSCNLMKYNSQNVINCIYGRFLSIGNFDPDDNFTNITDLPTIQVIEESIYIITYRALVLPGKEKEIVCYFSSNNIECYIYDISMNSIIHSCRIEPASTIISIEYIIFLEYFSEADEVLVGFVIRDSIYVSKCTKDLQCTENKGIKYLNYFQTYNYPNIVAPINNMNYHIIYFDEVYENIICSNCSNYLFIINNLTYDSIDNSFFCEKYYSYDHTECLTSIPKGYYCNSTIYKTIDKCHDNCETCKEGPTEENNKCLTCQSGLFFDSGNCVSECNYGLFIDENDNKICKCSEIKCKYCNYESKLSNLCLICNEDLGFYSKKNDILNSDSFINCYNDTTISNGYYLNFTTNQYEPCYKTCEKCYGLGDENDNKCISCLSKYAFIINNDNIGNCYPICKYKYYYDENNNYKCTSDNNCPENYKIINSTNKCIDNCLNDNIYNFHYEYNNTCYDYCPTGTYTLNSSNLCIEDLKCKEGYYYNYNHTGCILTIPEGYYCNSTKFRTIDKCHENCKTCEKGGTDSNNNCLICKDFKYFDLGNCTSNCIYGELITNNTNNNLMCKCSGDNKCEICTKESLDISLCVTCNNIEGYYPKIDDEVRSDGLINCYYEPVGYYLKNKSFYPCDSNCKRCIEIENTNLTECQECMEGYILKRDINNNIVCHIDVCEYYYYYDSNNSRICTSNSSCPENYNKLIISKYQCIEYCTKDDKYKFEYNHNCYESCPIGTHLGEDNNFLCQDNLNCNQSYFNYAQTECISSVPDGYYCNDTELKTIDKCHENCQKCNEGPSIDNNNCIKCNEPLYLEMGNCVMNCTNGILTNQINKECKCSLDIKCNSCLRESVMINKCLSCNEDEGYYQKYNDTNNYLLLINCYNKETIDDGYYLDKNLNMFIPCFRTCSKCSKAGDENNNNCEECKSGYSFNNITKNCEEKCNYYYYFDNKNKYHCTDGNNCPSNYNKLIEKKKRCIDDCNKDDTYKYEYGNQCHLNCPVNTIPNENNICITEQTELVCPEEYPYELVNKKICIKQCNATDLLSNICKINNPIAKNSGASNIKDSITDGSLNDILENVTKNGEDLIINEKDIKYQITTTSNQNSDQTNNNISTIKLGECENVLKEKYNISKDDPLLIFKIDAKIEGFSSTVVEYEVYHPITKEQLNLTYCQNTSIEIQIPVTIDEEEVYKYDPSSEYYNDICTTSTSDSGTDIILSDRQSEYVNNNLSLCESSCTYNGYDTTTKKAKCECNVKTSISDITNVKIDKDKFFDGFLDLKSLINISVMKCYKLLFSKKGFLNNIGNYILLPIIAYNILSSFLFYVKGYNLLKNQINKMVEKLKEYNPPVDENLTDKKIKIFDKKPKKSKNKKKKKKEGRKSKSKKKSKKNEEMNAPPKKNKKKKSISIIINNNNYNNYSDSLNTIKSTGAKYIFEKGPTMKCDIIPNKELTIKEKYDPKPEEKKIKSMEYYNDTELNNLDYKDALEIDKRTYFKYYISLIKKKQLLIFTFYPSNDYNSMIIKICLFLFSFVLYYTINALFFTDSTMHKIYEDEGAFNFFYHIPQILYSTIISSIINIIAKKLSLSENNVLTIKNEKNSENVDKKMEKVLKCLIIKFILFFIVCLLFLLLFWYYLACFCAVYKNTQYYLIKDTLISFSLSLLYPFGLNLLPGILRIPSLKTNNREFMYKFSQIVQII